MVEENKKEQRGEQVGKVFAVIVFGFLVYGLFNIDTISKEEGLL